MNCYTGEISADRQRIDAWKADGIPVLELGQIEDLRAAAEVQRQELGMLEVINLLDAIGARIVDAEAEARVAGDRKAQAFAARIHARR